MPIHYITTLHAWNARIVPLLGFPLNTLLFWLIWTKTPKEMRVHSRILLQTSVIDIIVLLIMLIASPFLFENPTDGKKITFFDGYLLKSSWALFGNGQNFLILLGSAGLTIFFFDFYGISAQFLYRYLVLNRDVSFNIPRYLLLLVFPFGAALILSFIYFIIIDAEQMMEIDENIRALLNDYIDLHNSVYIAVTSVNKHLNLTLLFNTINLICIIICCIVNIFCGIKMVTFVQSHADFNPRMKELNRQLTKNLIILAIFPLVIFSWTIVDFIALLDETDLCLHIQFFYIMMSTWITVANPMVSIWINRPYRDAVIKFIKYFIRKFKKTSDNAIHPNPAIAQ